MNMEEYLKVKDFTYLEYCDYLQQKYGIGLCNYMSENYRIQSKCKRTKDGLIAHHKMEDRAIMLSNVEFAKANPYEYQLKENIVYCDYLEHLLLHILICKYPAEDKNPDEIVGFGGAYEFLIPELNDVYSGWVTKQAWRKICYDKIINNKDVYLELLKLFVQIEHINPQELCRSFNSIYGIWSNENNRQLYNEIIRQCGPIYLEYLENKPPVVIKNKNPIKKNPIKKILSKILKIFQK